MGHTMPTGIYMNMVRVGTLIILAAFMPLVSAVYTDCPPNTPAVPNSVYDPPGPWPDDQSVHYVCDPHYKMVAGDGHMVCHITSSTGYHWHKLGTGPIPPECRYYYTTCEWTNITNGYIDPGPNTAQDGETVEYKCDYHYAIKGTKKAKCDIAGDEYSYTWKSVPGGAADFPPECIYSYWDCPSPGAIVGGFIDPPAPWANNDVMQYKCDPGLVLMGGDTGTCHIPADTFSYYWTYEPAAFPDWPPSCVVGYDFCLTPGAIVNGFISPCTTSNPWAPTDKVKYECDPHYKMFGTGEAECYIPYDKQSYQWQTTPLGMTDFPPNCVYRYDDCPSPGDLVINGQNVPPGPWVDNQFLDYQCDEHHIKFGADKAQCDISDDEISYQWIITPGNLGTACTPPVCLLGSTVNSKEQGTHPAPTSSTVPPTGSTVTVNSKEQATYPTQSTSTVGSTVTVNSKEQATYPTQSTSTVECECGHDHSCSCCQKVLVSPSDLDLTGIPEECGCTPTYQEEPIYKCVGNCPGQVVPYSRYPINGTYEYNDTAVARWRYSCGCCEPVYDTEILVGVNFTCPSNIPECPGILSRIWAEYYSANSCACASRRCPGDFFITPIP